MKFILYSGKEEKNIQLANSFAHHFDISQKFKYAAHLITSSDLDTQTISEELDIQNDQTIWLIPKDLKNNFDDILKDIYPNQRQQTSWKDYNPSYLSVDGVDGQEKGLKEFICSNFSENENPTTDSIIFSEILEIKENQDKTNDDIQEQPDEIPTDNKDTLFDRITDKIHIILVIIFIIVLYRGGIAIIDYQNKQTQIIKIEAQKALVDGDYNHAEKLADKVGGSYAQKMNIAIEENKRAIVHSEPEPEPKPEPEAEPEPVPKPVVSSLYNMLNILQQNSEIAFKTKRWTTPAHNNVVWWTSQMLQMEPQNTFAKEMLEKVINKYLQLHKNKKLTIPQLEQKINTAVLPKTKLKDYANTNQDWRIRQLLKQN